MNNQTERKAYIIGGGIAGLAVATFLITDGRMKGRDIYIFDQNPESGGSLDERGSSEKGYQCRGYRIFDKVAYSVTYDLLSKIPSLVDPEKSLADEFWGFNKKVKVNSKARLIKEGQIVNAYPLGLNWQDRFSLIKLLFLPESYFGTKQIKDYFTFGFFRTNFWLEWATTFSFEPWHSLAEMKRYLARFVHNAPYIDTMSCILGSPYCEHDFIVLPLLKWLKTHEVNFVQNSTVADLEFAEDKKNKIVSGISFQDRINVGKEDFVFLTNGSITEDSSVGSMHKAPELQTKKASLWNLWRDITKDFADLGSPDVFCSSVNKTKWESFTITFSDSTFFDLVEKLTGNQPGTGGLITFKDSNWLISIVLPHQPYFKDQPSGVFVCWGYGLISDKMGNYVNKKMTDCSGEEILEELCFHLGFIGKMPEIVKSAICLPVIMPYITSQFSPRNKTDRPEVVPKGSVNFACIGQYVEIPNEIVFTVEHSVRSAKIAVQKLLKLANKIPPIYQGKYNIKHVFRAVKTILR